MIKELNQTKPTLVEQLNQKSSVETNKKIPPVLTPQIEDKDETLPTATPLNYLFFNLDSASFSENSNLVQKFVEEEKAYRTEEDRDFKSIQLENGTTFNLAKSIIFDEHLRLNYSDLEVFRKDYHRFAPNGSSIRLLFFIKYRPTTYFSSLDILNLKFALITMTQENRTDSFGIVITDYPSDYEHQQKRDELTKLLNNALADKNKTKYIFTISSVYDPKESAFFKQFVLSVVPEFVLKEGDRCKSFVTEPKNITLLFNNIKVFLEDTKKVDEDKTTLNKTPDSITERPRAQTDFRSTTTLETRPKAQTLTAKTTIDQVLTQAVKMQ
jgi:hypothetical protein